MHWAWNTLAEEIMRTGMFPLVRAKRPVWIWVKSSEPYLHKISSSTISASGSTRVVRPPYYTRRVRGW